jgi:hypothetical protein
MTEPSGTPTGSEDPTTEAPGPAIGSEDPATEAPGTPIGQEDAGTEDPGDPVEGTSGARRPADTADVILIPPLGLDQAAQLAEAIAALKAQLGPKAKAAAAEVFDLLAKFFRAPAPTPPPSTTPPADPAPTISPKTP